MLCWLHDVPAWAKIAASYMRSGGCFYLAEFHPLAVSVCDGGVEGETFRMTFSYFPQPEPVYCNPGPTYTDGESRTRTGAYEWPYNLGQVVTARVMLCSWMTMLHQQTERSCTTGICLAIAVCPPGSR